MSEAKPEKKKVGPFQNPNDAAELEAKYLAALKKIPR